MKFTCMVVDDERHNIELLKFYVSKDLDLELIGAFENPVDGLAAANRLNPDMIFLDVDMPMLHGFDFAQQTVSTAKIILTTISSRHIEEAKFIKTAGHLLKPIPRNRFEACVNRIKKSLIKYQSKK